MANPMRDIERDSDYPELKLPHFEADLPQVLTDELTPEMRYIIEQQSIQSKKLAWLCEAMLDTNRQTRKTNGRVKLLETWKSKLTSGVSIVVVIFIILTSILTFMLQLFDFFGRISGH